MKRVSDLTIALLIATMVYGPIAPVLAQGDSPWRMRGDLPANSVAYIGWDEYLGPEGKLNSIMRGAIALQASNVLGDSAIPPEVAGAMERYIELLLKYPGAISVNVTQRDIDDPTAPIHFGVCLVMHAGADASRALREISDAMELLDFDDLRRASIDGQGVQRATVEDEIELLWWSAGEKVYVVLSTEAETYFAKLRDANGTAPADATFDTTLRQLKSLRPSDAPAPRIALYLDAVRAKSIVRHIFAYEEGSAAIEQAFDPIVAGLGLAGITALAGEASATLEASNYLSKSALGDNHTALLISHDGSYAGLMALFDQQPLTRADLELLPSDTTLAFYSNWDLHQTWETVREGLTDYAPFALGPIEAGRAVVRQFLGFSPIDDVLPAFGDTWIIYESPRSGGPLALGWTLIAEVDDEESVFGAFQRLAQLVQPFGAMGGADLDVRTAEYAGSTLHALVVGGYPVPFAPTCAFVGDRVVVGMSPQAVKLTLDDMQRAKAGDNLLKRAEIQQVRSGDRHLTTLAAGDPVRALRGYYGFLQMYQLVYATALPEQGSRGFDLAEIATLDEAIADVAPGLLTTQRGSNHVAYVGRGPSDLSGGALIVIPAVVAVIVSILVPAVQSVRVGVRHVVANAKMDALAMGLLTYATDNDNRYPDALQDLVPVYFPFPEELDESPRQPDTPNPYVYIAGQTTESDHRNILVYEVLPTAEYDKFALVIRNDHRAEYLPRPQFELELRQTYERLGRLDELPEEFR